MLHSGDFQLENCTLEEPNFISVSEKQDVLFLCF